MICRWFCPVFWRLDYILSLSDMCRMTYLTPYLSKQQLSQRKKKNPPSNILTWSKIVTLRYLIVNVKLWLVKKIKMIFLRLELSVSTSSIKHEHEPALSHRWLVRNITWQLLIYRTSGHLYGNHCWWWWHCLVVYIGHILHFNIFYAGLHKILKLIVAGKCYQTSLKMFWNYLKPS